MVQYGLVRSGMVPNGPIWPCTVLYDHVDPVWFCMGIIIGPYGPVYCLVLSHVILYAPLCSCLVLFATYSPDSV